MGSDTGYVYIWIFKLRQAGHAVMGNPTHVHARFVVVERLASKLLGCQTDLLASVQGGYVLENGVYRLQQFPVYFREVAHLRLFNDAVRFHVVHAVRRPVADRRSPGHCKPVHVIQVTVTGVLVEVNRPVSNR